MRTISLVLVTLLSVPALGAETAWQGSGPDVSIRMISSGDVGEDGKTLVALEIDMPANTKTYWRVPGETGIPTSISVDGSMFVADPSILWPLPVIDQAQGYIDYVYYGSTILPVEVTVSSPDAQLVANVMLGICSDICVPVQMQFELPLGDDPDRGNGLRIRQALAEVPLDWQRAGAAPIGSVWFDPEQEAIGLYISPDDLDTGSILGAFEGEGPLLGPARIDTDAGHAYLPIIGRFDPATIVDRPVDLQFATPMGPFRVTRMVGSP